MNKLFTLGFLALLSTSALAQPAFNGPINYAGAGGSSTGGGTGTVTSVGLSLPNIITVTGSPVTTSGTLTGTLATQSANTVFSGPTTGASATPTFRALVAADLPAGTGTVTSITAGNGISLSTNPCVTTCTASTTVTVNAQTGTTYPLATTDGGQVVSANNASSQAYSLSVASTTGFTAGYGFDLDAIGAGTVTLTATTSVFDNALTTLVINKGQDAYVWSDGTNYHSILSLPVMATNTYLGNTSGTGNYPTAQTFGTGVATALATNVSGSGAICLASGSACAGGLSAIAANSVLANFTAGSAVPIANSVPSCSTASSALIYTTATGFGCNTISGSGTVNAGTAGDGAYYATSTAAVSDAGSSIVTFGGITVASGSSPGTGIALSTASNIGVWAGGTKVMQSSATLGQWNVSVVNTNASGWQFTTGAASSTGPTLVPNRASSGTGWGAQASGNISGVIASVERFRFTNEGLFFIQATAPTVTGTGSPTIATGSSDTAGEATTGTAATSLIVTFNLTHTNAPFCVVTSQATLATALGYTISNTAITITIPATTGDKIDYHCDFH